MKMYPQSEKVNKGRILGDVLSCENVSISSMLVKFRSVNLFKEVNHFGDICRLNFDARYTLDLRI